MKNVLLLIAVFCCSSSFAADMQADTEKEILHLLKYLEDSNCAFNRNDTWYSTYKAVKHIEKKYRYYMKKGRINSAEQFIDLAASRSSMSGKPYLVRCGDSGPVESSTWFIEELKRFRKTYQ